MLQRGGSLNELKKMKKIAILGYGLEGKSLASFFKKRKNAKITILDKARDSKSYLKNLGRFDEVYRSPGVPYRLKEIQEVKKKVLSLTRLFFEEANLRGAKIIGITGSVGKTTTASLLYEILKKGGKKVFLAGNIGINPLSFLNKLDKKSIVVMELSSFQLEDLTRSPEIAILLDIFEEHLDKHASFKEYFSAKSNIARHQKKTDTIIFSGDNSLSKKMAKLSPGKKNPVSVSAGKKMGFRLKYPGEHNYKNAMAAAKAASLFGVSSATIKKTIEKFSGIEHRVEFIRELKGVKYYNNSKATNVGSALGGINSFKERKIVLIGGHNKNLDLTPLVKRLASKDIGGAIFFGEALGELVKIAKKIKFSNFSSAKRLREALEIGSKIAKSGDVVLLSPGTSSFDEFKNYEERGEKFKEWVKKLK